MTGNVRTPSPERPRAPLWPALDERRRTPEWMDDAELDPVLHGQALDALARIHRVSGTVGVLARAVRDLWVPRAGEPPAERRMPIRILDVGCGDGAVLLKVGKVAEAHGIPIRLHGCDISARALERARDRAAAAGLKLRLHRLDVTRDPLPHGFDLVTCSLFLHHFDSEDAVRILVAMRAAGSAVLVQDLLRTRLGYILAWAGVRLLSRSPVARLDGPLSVRGAYAASEVSELCARAGMDGAVIRRAWPERFVLEWTRPEGDGSGGGDGVAPDPGRGR